MSTLFLRTLREDPVDAEVPSHRLLVRAGYVRRAAPGIYSWLPLGYRVLRNVERIVREEMDAIGAQEVHFPALLPREPYEKSNRWRDYGDSIRTSGPGIGCTRIGRARAIGACGVGRAGPERCDRWRKACHRRVRRRRHHRVQEDHPVVRERLGFNGGVPDRTV